MTYWIYTKDNKQVGQFSVYGGLFSGENDRFTIDATINGKFKLTCKDLGLNPDEHKFAASPANFVQFA